MSQERRVWITGIGVTSALGPDCNALVQALREGRSGISRLSLFDPSHHRSQWAGQAPVPIVPNPPAHASRADLLGIQAAMEAVADAGLMADSHLESTAVILGTGAGGADLTLRYIQDQKQGKTQPPREWLIPHQPATTTDHIARALGLRGPRCSLMTACSSSGTAIGVGLDMIRLGRTLRAVAGGAEALCRLTFGGFSALRAMDEAPCRPFHRDRRGLTLGDGAAVVVLEDAAVARARLAHPYAEVAGYGVSADAHHLTAPPPDGRGAVLAMEAALRDAELEPDQVSYLNAHGTATQHNDNIEALAIRKVFGRHATRGLAVSSTKAMTGHTLGAAGALEATICALSIAHGLIPATLRLDQLDPACDDLDFVPEQPRRVQPEITMSNSFAFGGNNTSLVLRRVP